jgi:glycosyltransferase involved in cell wall biosynthesis
MGMIIKNKNIAFAVNSNKKFYHNTLPKVLRSLLDAGIKEDSIIVVVGGFDDELLAKEIEFELRDYWAIDRIYCIQPDSCDHTVFNFLLDKPKAFADFDYFFYMHDTCWVGQDFLKLFQEYTPQEEVNSFSLTPSWSMNIGLYNIKFLENKPQEIRRAFNTDNSQDSINDWKKWGALTEDYLMDRQRGTYFSFDPREVIKMENPYGGDTVRRTRYFYCLDFYKSQSNWQGVQPQMKQYL